MSNNPQQNEDALLVDVAEIHKQRFVTLVEHLARLRDVQYNKDDSESVIAQAKSLVALNLPSNLLRGASIFVDYLYGFPPDQGSFDPPAWVTTKVILQKEQRGSLVCEHLKDLSTLQESEVVVLVGDLPVHGLHAGMAGVVREFPSGDGTEDTCLVEFGEPQESLTIKADVPRALLRPPRPGDLFENYRL